MKTQDKSLVILFIAAFAATSSLNGQETPPAQVQPTLYSLKCVDAPLEVLLDRLQEVTGKTITVDLGVEARFTLKTAGKATASEMVDLITQALTAQGIRLENSFELVDDRDRSALPHQSWEVPAGIGASRRGRSDYPTRDP